MEQSLALTTQERRDLDLGSKITGWGADLDPAVRPGVPRDKAPQIGVESLYIDAEQQVPKFKIHKSTEHMRLTPVFGTSCPPKMLSGRLRDYAYTLGEGRLSHWLLLILADRVDVVENIGLDLAQGHVPNLWKEMGLSTELKYNRKKFIRKVAIAGLGFAALTALLSISKKSERRQIAAR